MVTFCEAAFACAVKLIPLTPLLMYIGSDGPIEPVVEVREIIGAVILRLPVPSIEPVEIKENVCPAPDADELPRVTAPVLLK